MYEIRVEAHFAAAHRLVDYQGDCEQLHGHNWLVEVAVEAMELDQRGLAIDFRELKGALKEVLKPLDHHMLNEIPPFDRENPSSERIARHLFEAMVTKLERFQVRLKEVKVWESPGASATYRA